MGDDFSNNQYLYFQVIWYLYKQQQQQEQQFNSSLVNLTESAVHEFSLPLVSRDEWL